MLVSFNARGVPLMGLKGGMTHTPLQARTGSVNSATGQIVFVLETLHTPW
jgi:hypothetical protein